MPGLGGVEALNNSSMMAVDYLPKHLLVIGGRYIGLEFAQIYRRFGSDVTVVEMGSRLISRDDDDVSEAVKGIMEAEGYPFNFGPNASASQSTATASRPGSTATATSEKW